ALVRFILGGAARPASGLLAPEHWAYTPLPTRRHDLTRARRLLDRAGYLDPDGPGPLPRFRLIYKTSNQPGRRRRAEAIQAAPSPDGDLHGRTRAWMEAGEAARAAAGPLEASSLPGTASPRPARPERAERASRPRGEPPAPRAATGVWGARREPRGSLAAARAK